MAGDFTAAWDKIGAHANITHTFTVKAKASGSYGIGPAMITCAASPSPLEPNPSRTPRPPSCHDFLLGVAAVAS